MSIVAECPHCETRFHLQPDLVGKTMRCPNPDCRETFVVREAARRRPASPPPPPPAPQVVDAVLSKPAPPRPTPPRPAPPPEPAVVDAVVVAPPPAKEVVWTPDADLPPPRPAPLRAASVADEDDEPVVRRRKKRANRGPVILIAMAVLIVVVGGASGFYLLYRSQQTEAEVVQRAEDEYKNGRYAEAEKAFEQLGRDYPGSDNAEKFRFFADLSGTQKAVRAVTNRENPRPALERLRAFIDAQKDSRFARPDAYGHDVFDAGRKAIEDAGEFTQDRVKAFRADRKKPDELKRAEEMIAAGREFLTALAPFRTKDDVPLDDLGKKAFDPVAADIAVERERLATMAQAGDLLKDPTDENIERAKHLLAEKGWAADDEGAGLIRAAEADFIRRVRYESAAADAQKPPAAAAASLLFVASVGPTRAAARGPADDPPAVFLAVVRGILYALDEDTGDPLWAARVGADVADPPAVARVDLPEGPTDLALVASNVAGQAAVSGYVLRTGQARWYQPLPAPPAGAAVVVGTRAFVPVRDAAGSVYVIDLLTGGRVGRVVLGQPAGAAVARPGTGQVFVAAESRRVYVFDTSATEGDGFRPRCTRVIPTGHAAGTLRTPPVLLGPPGDQPAPRWLVLTQADGPAAMKLRAFPLPPTPAASGDSTPVTDAIPARAELPLPGWAWFPPLSDGEQLAVVTDAGQVRLFGLNQAGNDDADLFPYPHPTLPTPPGGEPVPGLAVPAEDGALWVLAGGRLQKFRLSVQPEKGQVVVPVGPALPVGVPTQPPQLNPRRDTACFVVRSATSSGCRAVAVRLRDGEPRWQRQLGVFPGAAPVRTADGVLLVGEDGGVVAVPAAGAAVPAGAPAKAAPEWVLATPTDGATGQTRAAASADGKTVYTVTPAAVDGAARWVIRRVSGGKLDDAGFVPAKAALAGPVAVLGDALLVPAADGFVYRLTPGAGRLQPAALAPGPKWLFDRRRPDAVCFIVPLTGDSFLTSDGGGGLKRWEWPADGSWTDGRAKWDGRERIAGPPVLLPAAGGRPSRLLVADVAGGVWLYPAERGDAPSRRWVPGRTASLPGGTIPHGLAVRTDAAGRQLVCYAVEGKQPEEKWLVCLDADRDEPLWVRKLDPAGGVVGQPSATADGHWIVTDLAGRVSVLDAETGQVAATRDVGLPGAVPATAGVPVGDTRVLVPLSDGSAAVIELPAAAPNPNAKAGGE